MNCGSFYEVLDPPIVWLTITVADRATACRLLWDRVLCGVSYLWYYKLTSLVANIPLRLQWFNCWSISITVRSLKMWTILTLFDQCSSLTQVVDEDLVSPQVNTGTYNGLATSHCPNQRWLGSLGVIWSHSVADTVLLFTRIECHIQCIVSWITMLQPIFKIYLSITTMQHTVYSNVFSGVYLLVNGS